MQWVKSEPGVVGYGILLYALLLGLAVLGKGLAIVGVPPVYASEVVLAVGLLVALVNGVWRPGFRQPVVWCLLLFCGWAAVRTVVYLPEYGVDCLRDGVLWGYSAHAMVVASLLGSRTLVVASVDTFLRCFVRAFAILAPITWLISAWAHSVLPMVPGTDVPIISQKPSDLLVLASLAFSAMVVGMTCFPRPLWSSLLVVLMLMTVCLSRAGMLAAAGALLVLLLGFWRSQIYRGAMLAAAVILLVSFLGDLSFRYPAPPEVHRSSLGREVSARQLLSNILGIAGIEISGVTDRAENRQKELDAIGASTMRWRLDWWTVISDYTIFGPYFWQGKGYGINLADDDGFQMASGDRPRAPLRHPHNGHMSVLARSGVVGLALWALLWVAWLYTLLSARRRFRNLGDTHAANLCFCLFAGWIAFMINASFDVYLEGPMAGVWFWCLVGGGIALGVASQKVHVPSSEPTPAALTT